MAAIVDRQAGLRSAPRFAVQQDSFHTPVGEVFPQLDRLSFDGNRVRVEYEHVLEPGNGAEPTMLRGTFHLQPDPGGRYHLDALGWMLQPAPPGASILRPVTSTTPVDVDQAARSLVTEVEKGEIPFDAALSTPARRRDRNESPTPQRHKAEHATGLPVTGDAASTIRRPS